MSTETSAEQAMTLRLGRRAPYTYLGDWVGLSGATVQAKTLYWFLSMHINVSRKDTVVWPSRRRMAAVLGLKQARGVDRYVTELITLGAIEKEPQKSDAGDWAPNEYLIHQTPPKGYAQPVDLEDWYNQQNAGKTQEKPAQRVVRSSAPPSAPQSTRGSALERTQTKRTTTKRNNKGFLPSVENPPPPTPAVNATKPLQPAKPQKAEGEEQLRKLKEHNPEAAAFIDALPVGTKAPTTRHLLDMVTEIARLMAGNADLDAVRRELLADHRSSGHRFAVMVARAKNYQPQKFRTASPETTPGKRRQIASEGLKPSLAPMDRAERRKKRLELAQAAKEEQNRQRVAAVA